MSSRERSKPWLAKRATPKGVYAKLAGKTHLHGCIEQTCRAVYTDNCRAPATNARCNGCRGARVPIWDVARQPRPCCQGNTQQVTSTEELLRYDLAGPGPWFQCKTCARCHPRPCV